MNFCLRTTAFLACVGLGLAATSARATVLDFDSGVSTTYAPFAPFVTSGDALVQNDFFIATLSTKAGAQAGDLTGLLVDGADSSTCFNLTCPSNNVTTYLALVDDGLPIIGTLSGEAFRITSFDAAFIAAAGATVPSVPLVLRVLGFVGDTQYYEDVLPGGLTSGASLFNTYTLSSTFASRSYDQVDFFGYACDSAGTCDRAANAAQFGLDNINVTVAVTAVPEPSSYALMVLGLAGLGLVRRRSVRS